MVENMVGRKAFIQGIYFDMARSGVCECVRQEDDNFFVFRLTECSELVVYGYEKVSKIRWIS